MPEVIDDVITGFVASGEAEAIQAIGRLSELDRRKVRRHFEKRFTATRMAQEYLRGYEALVQANAGQVQADIRSVLPQGSISDRPVAP